MRALGSAVSFCLRAEEILQTILAIKLLGFKVSGLGSRVQVELGLGPVVQGVGSQVKWQECSEIFRAEIGDQARDAASIPFTLFAAFSFNSGPQQFIPPPLILSLIYNGKSL